MLTYSHNERVVFNRLFSNVGGGYDSLTGLFRCPQSGVYVFEINSLSHQDKTVWLQLYKNYNYVISTYGHSASDYGSAGNSVVLKLAKNDEVYVKAVDPKNGAATSIYGASDEVYSTFSGYLLSPVFEEYPVVG
ncbi:hypothetical protein KUTeg_002415 [Tegillarca granosa]|uniref:C1q domain-containing protein n=1 Tax=Tegillarca granosa TaxID=220873 RepID=A0ABQ9FUA0_TEGGR|nr:hypothetical protein KUTeg_002415 [Tegillarca granosa]